MRMPEIIEVVFVGSGGRLRISPSATQRLKSTKPQVIHTPTRACGGRRNHAFQLDAAVAEGRSRTFEQLGWIMYWIFLSFVLVGAVVLAKTSWRRLTIMAVPIFVVALNVAIVVGDTRIRVAAEPSLAVLAAVGIAAVAGRTVAADDPITRPFKLRLLRTLRIRPA